MTVVHVYVGEKRIGIYPDCSLLIGPADFPYIYVTPEGTEWEARSEKFVLAFPIANTNMSAVAIRQEDKK